MQKMQLKFLLTLCALYDGEKYVLETDIRKHWRKCPSHFTILRLGNGVYFDCNFEHSAMGYIPTAQGLSFVREHRHSSVLLAVGITTLVVALLTLAATLLLPLPQASLQQ